MKLEVKRYIFNTDVRSTIGDLLIDGKFFCYTLEDEVRNDGVKVYGKTAIPHGEYKVVVTPSSRFKRDMPLIYNRKDEKSNYWVEGKDGIKWEGVRAHGGNTEANTLGCILVAHNTDGKKIWGTAEKELTAILKKEKDITIKIENAPFYKGNFVI